MFDCIDLIELDEACSRYGMYGLTGRIRDEMQMKPRHRRAATTNVSIIPRPMCIAR
jgi:hypothetical protein